MSHLKEGSPDSKYIHTANSRLAAVAAALAISAGTASAAEGYTADASGYDAIEAVEANPMVRSKEILLKKLAENEVPNRVLNIAVTFSIDPDKPSFYYTPYDLDRPNTKLPAYHGERRRHWFGQYPRYIHSHGEDWLAFVDTLPHNEEPFRDPVFGPARDTQNTLFLKASDMPDDTRIFTFSRSGIGPAKRVLPARVDKRDNIMVKGLPMNASEIMLGFAEKKEINNIIAGQSLVRSKLRSLENLK
jgi:hypothetical protein